MARKRADEKPGVMIVVVFQKGLRSLSGKHFRHKTPGVQKHIKKVKITF